MSPASPLLHHLRRQVRREGDGVADPQPLAGLGEDVPGVGALALVEGGFDLDLSPLAGQAGGDDAGVVVDQQVAGLQQVGQVADMAVRQGGARTSSRRAASRGRAGSSAISSGGSSKSKSAVLMRSADIVHPSALGKANNSAQTHGHVGGQRQALRRHRRKAAVGHRRQDRVVPRLALFDPDGHVFQPIAGKAPRCQDRHRPLPVG